MSTARADAGYITVSHRLFWKRKQEGFLGSGQCNSVCGVGFTFCYGEGHVISFPRCNPGHIPNGVGVNNSYLYAVITCPYSDIESDHKFQQTLTG